VGRWFTARFELGYRKAAVRQISGLGFPWWRQPANPCLLPGFPMESRFSACSGSRGSQTAKSCCASRAWREMRVRKARAETARIEVPVDQPRTCSLKCAREDLVTAFRPENPQTSNTRPKNKLGFTP